MAVMSLWAEGSLGRKPFIKHLSNLALLSTTGHPKSSGGVSCLVQMVIVIVAATMSRSVTWTGIRKPRGPEGHQGKAMKCFSVPSWHSAPPAATSQCWTSSKTPALQWGAFKIHPSSNPWLLPSRSKQHSHLSLSPTPSHWLFGVHLCPFSSSSLFLT